jgi:hypothetical protein
MFCAPELAVQASHHQTAAQGHDIQLADKSFENMAEFIYLGATVTNQITLTRKLRADYIRGTLLNLLTFRLLKT